MVFRRNQNRIKHSILILLQFISRNYKSFCPFRACGAKLLNFNY